MSRENVEIVRRLHETAARGGDAGSVLAFYAPEIVWDVSHSPLGELEGPSIYRGYDGLRRFFRSWREAWGDMEYVSDELLDAGEHVISIGRQCGRGRASGARVEGTNQTAVWTLRDGKIVRVVWFGTREEALHAAGLRE